MTKFLMRASARIAAILLPMVAMAGMAAAQGDIKPLPRIGADIAQTSVSGISSGAYMAGQFQLAHGKIVVGAAVIAGGPYGCAETTAADTMWLPGMSWVNLTKALNGCMLGNLQAMGVPDPEVLAERARKYAKDGAIDALSEVAKDRVYLFAGKNDVVVAPGIVARAVAFYKQLGVPEQNIRFVTDIPAGHAFVTETEGGSCELSAPPFVAHCNYDQAGDLLAHIYDGINPPGDAPAGTLTVYDQREFTKDLGNHGMAETGTVYVPAACTEKPGCRIHVAFHGCGQNRAAVGESFVVGTGFARWADANRIIVLYPEAAASFVNTQGCWDWWGYTGADFLTKKAPQIVAVRRMVDRLAGKKG